MSEDREPFEIFLQQQFQAFLRGSFMGRSMTKLPSDLMVIQEIISECRPRTIVEVGSYCGGAAQFYGLLQAGRKDGSKVITVDRRDVPPSDFFVSVRGDCQEVFGKVQEMVEGPCMVLLDCCHEAGHVYRELLTYGRLVTPGQYLVVEDTAFDGEADDASGNGVVKGAGRVLARWNKNHSDFVVDHERERWGLTYNPGGFLRRVSEPRGSS